MTLAAFNLAIDRFLVEDIPEEVNKLARIVAATALQKVVLKSPVDTGRFRGAWHVTIGVRSDSAPPKPEGVKSGSRGRSRRSADSGSRAIAEGLGVINGSRPFESIILQNNVEYGEALEDGGSKQAPRGMVAVTVAEIQQVFE